MLSCRLRANFLKHLEQPSLCRVERCQEASCHVGSRQLCKAGSFGGGRTLVQLASHKLINDPHA